MTNNFDLILPMLDFSQEGTFYYIQLMRRKKDNPDAKSVKVIKDMYVDNLEYLQDREESIIEMCDFFNARAYIRMNRRSYQDVSYQLNVDLAKSLQSNQYKHVSRLFSKACGRTHVEPNKVWVIDLDFEDVDMSSVVIETRNYMESTIQFKEYRQNILNTISELQSEINNRDYKIIGEIPTPNGLHILTNPFNVKKFNERLPDIDIHKDNPTILYTP